MSSKSVSNQKKSPPGNKTPVGQGVQTRSHATGANKATRSSVSLKNATSVSNVQCDVSLNNPVNDGDTASVSDVHSELQDPVLGPGPMSMYQNSSLEGSLNDDIESDGQPGALSVENVEGLDDSEGMQCDDIVNDFIAENYGLKIPEDHLGPPVANLLASTIDRWCFLPPTKEIIKQAFEQCKVPSNVTALGPIKINDIIYHRLPSRAKEHDKLARKQATYYTRAMGPLCHVWDVLIKAEAWALKTKAPRPALKTQDEVVPVRDLVACLSAAMKLLCLHVSLYLQRRKSALRPHLDPRYHVLAGPTNLITKWLFGDDLEQKISEIFRVSQAARSSKYHGSQDFTGAPWYKGARQGTWGCVWQSGR